MTKAVQDLDLNQNRIRNGAPPLLGGDLVNKDYADSLVNGLDWKQSVRAATTANITLTGTPTVDGVALVAGNRVLVKDQSVGSQNGIYVVAAGSWTRSGDADTSAEVTTGLAVFIEEGTANGNQQWSLTTDAPITLGTTALVFAQVGAQSPAPAAGDGLTLTSNTYAVGAGTGITVTADAVAVDTAVVPRKMTATLGNGSATTFQVDHNLGYQYPIAEIYDIATGERVHFFDQVATSINRMTVTFSTAPSTNQYRIVITG